MCPKSAIINSLLCFAGYILSTMQAQDADTGTNGEVRYSLSGEDIEAFSMDPLTGGLCSDFSS